MVIGKHDLPILSFSDSRLFLPARHHWNILNKNIYLTYTYLQGRKSHRSFEWFALFKNITEGFPGGAVVENLPANAGDTGSSPGLGGSHMPWSDWAHEPQLLSLRIWSLCSVTGGAAIVGGPRTAMKSGPRLPQLEKALAQRRRPDTAIDKDK